MKFLLIDAMGLVFRAYHAMSKMGLQAPNGELTSAVFGFGNILSTILAKEQPDYLCVAFDTAAPTFRHEKFDQYKAHRPEFPQDLVPQLLRIKQLVSLLNIKQVELAGYEADDIIGTLAIRTAQAHPEVSVYCVTSDKDYCQLVSERIKLLRPGFSLGEYDTVDIAGVEAKFGVRPSQVVDVLALIGDASDNVPGVKGIGEKTAIPLIQQYGSLEGVYTHLADISKEAVRKKLDADRAMAALSKELVTIHTNVPIDYPLSEFAVQKPDVAALKDFFLTLGFKTMLAKFVRPDAATALSQPTNTDAEATLAETLHTAPTEPLKRLSDVPHQYTTAQTAEEIDAMVNELRATLTQAALKHPTTPPLLAFDCETTSLDTMTCEIVGMSFAASEGRAFYVPLPAANASSVPSMSNALSASSEPSQTVQPFVQGSLFDAVPAAPSAAPPSAVQTMPHKETSQMLPRLPEPMQRLLEDPNVLKCGQHAKFDAVILRRYGVTVTPIAFDSMLASYVLNADAQHGMDALAQQWLHYAPIPISALIGDKPSGKNKQPQRSMRDVETERIAEYAAEDADVTLQLAQRLRPELERAGLLSLAERTEFALVEVLTEMEFNGIAIDTDALGSISALLKVQMEELKRKIFQEVAQFGIAEFNVDSPKQLGDILFDTMKIPPVKKTKTGYSTDSSVLEELAAEHPIAELVLEYRQLAKLQSTYIEALPKLVNPSTGRVHTTFNQTVTSTGRLSSTDPNLQNIPIRTELGREIRRAFIAAKADTILLSADYSQIELRIMAHICGDETLVAAFERGVDIHAATAATLFDVPVGEVSRDQRRVAKTVNFGVMYGLGAFGLARRLNIARSEGKEIIDNYFAKYPRIKDYIESTIASTRQQGFASTLLGRRKYYPDIQSANRVARTAAERAAINMPIQGTAADMMKLAMVSIYRAMKAQRLESKMLLQIHDELVFEMPQHEAEILPPLVKSCMESAFLLGAVPVVAELGTGKNWAEAH
jgi:DNA polymerase-1